MRALIPVLVAGLTPFLVLALIVTGTGLQLIARKPPIIWTDHFGTAGPGTRNGVASVSTNGTVLYTAGFVGLPVSGYFSPTPSYVFLDRYDGNGVQVWTQRLGNPQYDEVSKIVAGSDGVYLVKTENLAVFIQKYSLTGSEIWSSQWGNQTGSSPLTSLSLGWLGPYAVTVGNTIRNGTSPVVVRSYDPLGRVVWTKTLGNETGVDPTGANIGPVSIYVGFNELYVAGSDGLGFFDSHAFFSKYYFNGTRIWMDQFDTTGFTCDCEPTGISSDSSGSYVTGQIMNAFPGQSSAGGFDGFIRKYDQNGNPLWTVQFSAPDFSGVESVEISASSSGVYVAETTIAFHGFILKYDGNGNLVWSFQVSEFPNAISTGTNSIYLGGSLAASPSQDAFVQNVAESSSLVFFGLNPPLSFGVVAILAGLVTLSILCFRRLRRKTHRSRSMTAKYGFKGDIAHLTPSDVAKRISMKHGGIMSKYARSPDLLAMIWPGPRKAFGTWDVA